MAKDKGKLVYGSNKRNRHNELKRHVDSMNPKGPMNSTDSMTVKPSQWTVMVYMAADNNLDRAALKDIAEMAKVGSTEKVNILVYARHGRELVGWKSPVREPC